MLQTNAINVVKEHDNYDAKTICLQAFAYSVELSERNSRYDFDLPSYN